MSIDDCAQTEKESSKTFCYRIASQTEQTPIGFVKGSVAEGAELLGHAVNRRTIEAIELEQD